MRLLIQNITFIHNQCILCKMKIPKSSWFQVFGKNSMRSFAHSCCCWSLGYKGYVPREKYLHGRGHKEQTHSAVVQFGREQSDSRFIEKQPIEIDKPKPPAQYEGVVIYPECSGVIPKFYGYVPGIIWTTTIDMIIFLKLFNYFSGEKFRFGRRFGESTKNALKVGDADSLQPSRSYNCDDKNCGSIQRSKTMTNISISCN